jgi:hypothetical protein
MNARFFISILVAVLLAGRLSAQIDLGYRTFLSSEQLIASAGSESLAAEIIGTVFSQTLFVRDPAGVRVHILSRQIPRKFSRFDDDAAQTHLSACGSIKFVQSLKVITTKLVQVVVGDAVKCHAVRTVFTFERVGNEWRLPRNRKPDGWSMGSGHCECLGSR